jgi:RsiW-degrading membrane proteinase PrsW (M82 family)
MNVTFGVLRVLSARADAGHPPPGQWLPERDLVFPVAQSMTTLGRGLHNAIVLFDPHVAAEHACLHYTPDNWTVENCSASDPLLVGGEPVAPGASAPIHAGECLQLGATRLQLVAPEKHASLAGSAELEPNASFASSALSMQSGAALRLAWKYYLTGWRLAGFITLCAIFGIMLVLIALSINTLVMHRAPGGFGFLTAFTFPLIPVIGVFALITLIDRYERKPWYLLLGAFLWGAVIAIPPTFFSETTILVAIGHYLSSTTATWPGVWENVLQNVLKGLSVGLIEEAVKDAGLVVLLVILRHRLETVADGILYGVVIGAGFGMVENIIYFTNTDSASSLAFLVVGRILLGWLSHSTFTACFGAALGLLRERMRPHRPWLVPLWGFLIGALLHSIFDFVGFQAATSANEANGAPGVTILALLAIIADYIPLFIAQVVLYVMLVRSLAREAAILREYLVDEVRRGLVPPEDYALLQRASLRQRLIRSLLFERDVRLWLATRRLYAAEVRLAFSKWRQERNIEPDVPPQAYRLRIRRLRRVVAGQLSSA